MNLATAQTALAENCFDSEKVSMETVLYNSVSIDAHVIKGNNLEFERQNEYATIEIEVQVSDVTAPANGDVVIVFGETWKYRQTLSGDEISNICIFDRDRRPRL